MSVLAICVYSLDKSLFRSSALFPSALVVFLLLSCIAVYIFWKLSPYQLHHFQIFASS